MKTIERGTVLRVSRGVYDHYGVYVGNDEIVHFTSYSSDKGSDNTVMKTDMRMFIRGAESFDVMAFPESLKDKSLLKGATFGSIAVAVASAAIPLARVISGAYAVLSAKSTYSAAATDGYHFYTKDECAERAEQCIGLAGYDLLERNCEHLAIWCKTGIQTSTQVNKLIEMGIEKSRTLRAYDYIPL